MAGSRAGRSVLSLPSSPLAPSLARSFVARWWQERDLVGDLDDLLLLTSELVTNAVRHSSRPRAVTIFAGPGWVRVEVTDASAARPVMATGRRWNQSGRGLALVQSLSLDSGADLDAEGKSVWFTITATDAAELPGEVAR
jgi:anti-sigma regulatory factor (Ser/Thr protein kinase)